MAKYEDTEEGRKKAWEACTEKEKDFLMYYIGFQKPPSGVDCYGNRSKAYFYAYHAGKGADIKETVKSTNEDGDVTTREEYTTEFKTSMANGSKKLKKTKIRRAKKHLNDRFEPIERLKELGNQRGDKNISYRASTKLAEINGDAPDEGQRQFRSFMKELANSTEDDE